MTGVLIQLPPFSRILFHTYASWPPLFFCSGKVWAPRAREAEKRGSMATENRTCSVGATVLHQLSARLSASFHTHPPNSCHTQVCSSRFGVELLILRRWLIHCLRMMALRPLLLSATSTIVSLGTSHCVTWLIRGCFALCNLIDSRLIYKNLIVFCCILRCRSEHINVNAFIHVYTSVRVCVCLCVCSCVRVYIYVYIYTLQHTCNTPATHLQHTATHYNTLAVRWQFLIYYGTLMRLTNVSWTVCCSVLQCVAVCCIMFQWFTVCCTVTQCVVVCCGL